MSIERTEAKIVIELGNLTTKTAEKLARRGEELLERAAESIAHDLDHLAYGLGAGKGPLKIKASLELFPEAGRFLGTFRDPGVALANTCHTLKPGESLSFIVYESPQHTIRNFHTYVGTAGETLNHGASPLGIDRKLIKERVDGEYSLVQYTITAPQNIKPGTRVQFDTYSFLSENAKSDPNYKFGFTVDVK